MTTRSRGKSTAKAGRGEVLHDSRGRIVDDEYVDRAVGDALAQIRGRGRPSLSDSGDSPVLHVRVSRDLDEAVRDAAQKSGVSVSGWVRRALELAARGESPPKEPR